MSDMEVLGAIAAITREEETWQAIRIEAHQNTIFQVGRLVSCTSGLVFYQREVTGSTELGIPALRGVSPEYITHEEALASRNRLDAQWSSRPIIHGHILKFWQRGLLKTYSGNVGGIFNVDPDVDSDLPSLTLFVSAIGAVSLRIDNPAVEEDGVPLKWHEYLLPRGSSKCIRELETVKGVKKHITVVNGDEIVRNVKKKLELIERITTLPPRKSLRIRRKRKK